MAVTLLILLLFPLVLAEAGE
jgi:hypothetical protein